MPIYEFRCKVCNARFDEFVRRFEDAQEVKHCGIQAEKLVSSFVASVWPSEGITLENVEAQPKTFYSRKEMVDYAKKNNLELGAL